MPYASPDATIEIIRALAAGQPTVALEPHLDTLLLWLSNPNNPNAAELDQALDTAGLTRLRASTQAYEILERIFFTNADSPSSRTLGLPKNVTPEVAKRRYRRLIQVYHPDRHPNHSIWATRRTEQLNRAFDVYRRLMRGEITPPKPASEPPPAPPPPSPSPAPVEAQNPRLSKLWLDFRVQIINYIKSLSRLQQARLIGILSLALLAWLIYNYLTASSPQVKINKIQTITESTNFSINSNEQSRQEHHLKPNSSEQTFAAITQVPAPSQANSATELPLNATSSDQLASLPLTSFFNELDFPLRSSSSSPSKLSPEPQLAPKAPTPPQVPTAPQLTDVAKLNTPNTSSNSSTSSTPETLPVPNACHAVPDILLRFQHNYETGKLDPFMELYSPLARENNLKNWLEIKQAYQDWFAQTSARRLRFAQLYVRSLAKSQNCLAVVIIHVNYLDQQGSRLSRTQPLEILFEPIGSELRILRIYY